MDDSGLPGVDISSERSGVEAREGGELINGKRYSRISRPMPATKPKMSATTQKYPTYNLTSENFEFSYEKTVGVSPLSHTSKK